MEFLAAGDTLCAAPVDYHTAPLHLGEAELTRIGLRLVADSDASLPASMAKPWAAGLRGHADRAARGPATTDPNWSLPLGHRSGGFLFARVHRGLDIFVTDYHAGPARLSAADLASLGLAWQPAERSLKERT